MKVLLSGYNLDSTIIDELKEKADWQKDNVTPETLSAAYARISRDPRDIEELRKESREELDKARKSNETIIFGLGHGSVAEHAYFNFDIIGLSRFAVEQVQKFRFASFTEKSQRYITLEDDYIIPEEIADSGFGSEFKELIRYQNEAYHILYEALSKHLFEKYSDLTAVKSGRRTVDGWAKEDARYVVSMATESQFGMSLNARSLENMLRQLGNSELAECRELAEKLYALVKDISPSIIKYVEPTEYDRFSEPELIEFLSELPCEEKSVRGKNGVKLISCTPEPDREIAKTVVASHLNISYDRAECIVRGLDENKLKELITRTLKYRMPYDTVKRYFEFAEAAFEIVVSSSNYAQLKRHRPASMLPGPYDISLGVTVPENIKAIGMEKLFNDVIEKTDDLYLKMKDLIPYHSQYILTNAHRRVVLLKMNFRELYHFMSLRLDEHAQWDIRNTAELMLKELSLKAPLSTMMMCGKSCFKSKTEEVFEQDK